ncbi:MAG: 2TM domain-containing protein [Kaistella sp.]
MENYNQNEIKYLEAKKRVKRLKGFYIHATVYILVNLFLIANNVQRGMNFFDINNYWTAIFWGVGLLGHALSVFLPNMIMGKDWEEKKIRELMDKNK